MQTFKQNYPFKVRVFMDGHLCGEPVYKTAEEAMAAMSKWLRKGADYVECVDHVQSHCLCHRRGVRDSSQRRPVSPNRGIDPHRILRSREMENSYRQLDIFDIEVLLQMVEHAQARATKDARRDPTNDVPLIAMRFYKTTADKLRAMAADMGDEA